MISYVFVIKTEHGYYSYWLWCFGRFTIIVNALLWTAPTTREVYCTLRDS